MSKLLKGIKKAGFIDQNVALTDNGALSNRSTKDKVLDMFANFGTMRLKSNTEILKVFKDAYFEDKDLAMKCLFYFRDVRQGQGQRKLFHVALDWLARENPTLVAANLDNILFYGRGDDLHVLFNTPVKNDVVEYIRELLEADTKKMRRGESVSLYGKWAPSISTSSKETRNKAYFLSKELGLSPRNYRKMLSALRAHLNIVERQMCAQDWESIDYNIVPSRASMLYRNAFKKHNPTGYTKWQEQVKKGEKGAKVNASVLYPYELVNRVRESGDQTTLDLQWQALPNYIQNDESFLALVDVSGSMDKSVSDGVTAMDVAVSLGLYCAERAKGPFKNHFMTFSNQPQLVEVAGKTLYSKVNNLIRSKWDMNTNLFAAFKLILDTAVKNKLKQSDLPNSLLIISDLEFDSCRDNSLTNFEAAKRLFQAKGYTLPKVIFWRVNALKAQVPVTKNEINTVLISGFSPTILQYLFDWKITTPHQKMLDVLNGERYSRVITEVQIKPLRNKVTNKPLKFNSVNDMLDDLLGYNGVRLKNPHSKALSKIIQDEVVKVINQERKQSGLLDQPRDSGFKNSKQKRDKSGRFLKSA